MTGMQLGLFFFEFIKYIQHNRTAKWCRKAVIHICVVCNVQHSTSNWWYGVMSVLLTGDQCCPTFSKSWAALVITVSWPLGLRQSPGLDNNTFLKHSWPDVGVFRLFTWTAPPIKLGPPHLLLMVIFPASLLQCLVPYHFYRSQQSPSVTSEILFCSKCNEVNIF